jgi:hypothetical protein
MSIDQPPKGTGTHEGALLKDSGSARFSAWRSAAAAALVSDSRFAESQHVVAS